MLKIKNSQILISKLIKNNSFIILTKHNTLDIQKMALALNKQLININNKNLYTYNLFKGPEENKITYLVEKILKLKDSFDLNENQFIKIQESIILTNALKVLEFSNESYYLKDLEYLLCNYNDEGRKIVMKLYRKRYEEDSRKKEVDTLVKWFLNEYYVSQTNMNQSNHLYIDSLYLRNFISFLIQLDIFKNEEDDRIDISKYLHTGKENMVFIYEVKDDIDKFLYECIKLDIEKSIKIRDELSKINNLKDYIYLIYDDENGLYASRNNFTLNEIELLNQAALKLSNENENKISEKIKEMRKTYNLNQDEMAQVLGVSKNFLSDVERNVKSLSFDKLVEFCNTFDLSLDAMIETNKNSKEVLTNILKSKEIKPNKTNSNELKILARPNKNIIPKEN